MRGLWQPISNKQIGRAWRYWGCVVVYFTLFAYRHALLYEPDIDEITLAWGALR